MVDHTTRSGAPPFRLEVRMPLPAQDLAVDLTVRSAAGAELEDTIEVLSYFFRAATAGAFPGEGAAPGDSTFEVHASETTAEGEHSVRGTARKVAPGAWRILLNMLVQMHYKLDPLAGVRLQGESKEGRTSVDLARVLGFAYPRRASAIPFPVNVTEHLPDSSDFVVRMEFAKRVGDELLEAMEESFLDWDSIVYVGGFYDDFAEMTEPCLDPTETYRAGLTSIEHRVRAWNAPTVALESLINLAVALDSNWPVVRMEIE